MLATNHVTREELYARVWEEPMRTLAPKFGLSDVGWLKICRKLHVPRPWRGYWRAKETGHLMQAPRLPPWPGPGDPPRLTMVREDKAAMNTPSADLPESVRSRREYEGEPENAIPVPADLSAPCRLVRRARNLLRQSRAGHRGVLTPREYPPRYLRKSPNAWIAHSESRTPWSVRSKAEVLL